MNPRTSDVILELMMSLHPKIMDLALDRVWRLLAALGDPHKDLPPAIHIAGTNGKGSTQAMLRAGLEGAGKAVHAYTSPHLVRFHERILLAGDYISEEALSQVLDTCETANGDTEITYFEITTCAALYAFAQTPADYTLLEVGLGGRVDATNVVDKPALTVITPVSIDHQQYLGDTLGEIAFEKAGIIKRGVPCIVGPQEDAALEVIERQAAKLGAPLFAHGQHWHVWEERGRLVFQDENGLLDLPMPALAGPHQIQNAGAAIAGLRVLGFNETACEAAMRNVTWPARMQRLRKGPLVDAAPEAELILDGGHNPAAGRSIAASLKDMPNRPLHMIAGMLNTKDVAGYLRPFADQVKSLQAVSIPGQINTLSAQDMVAVAKGIDMNASAAETATDALAQIIKTDPKARVLIGGSLYFAGVILENNS